MHGRGDAALAEGLAGLVKRAFAVFDDIDEIGAGIDLKMPCRDKSSDRDGGKKKKSDNFHDEDNSFCAGYLCFSVEYNLGFFRMGEESQRIFILREHHYGSLA